MFTENAAQQSQLYQLLPPQSAEHITTDLAGVLIEVDDAKVVEVAVGLALEQVVEHAVCDLVQAGEGPVPGVAGGGGGLGRGGRGGLVPPAHHQVAVIQPCYWYLGVQRRAATRLKQRVTVSLSQLQSQLD